MKILLVEDNPADTYLIRQIFSCLLEDGWQVYEVETLEDAIATYRQAAQVGAHPFDLVLLDLGLPDAKGLETVQQFLAMSPEALIVVLSGNDDESLALQAIEEGAQDYLIKCQITLEGLLKSIRFALRRQSNLQQLRFSNDSIKKELNEAESLNEHQIEAINMISHELINPLGVIQCFTELIEVELENSNDGHVQTWLTKIHGASDKAIYFLRNTLSLLRLKNDPISYHPSKINLREFCISLVDEVQLIYGKGHSIVIDIPENLNDISTDDNLLRISLFNLLSNALKYTCPEDTIQIQATAQDSMLMLAVKDSGMGIPEADLQSLFNYFYRASNAACIAGTGLGLSIVKRCVDGMNGEIDIQSELDVGTTVTLKLPL